ncbi:No mechanoreceptor potential B [Strongyloides ratti]|uniref:No mechanoreceptor potential B n=1 Tax=Strongyloides ratti TaxID=34506 RepID=A0A090MYS7_STRRB|nr:No mechanoreceptor potential B [Strongyloides ratti]CEF67704.1 No mechanoreceptor potential B [Strongyloides ratti]
MNLHDDDDDDYEGFNDYEHAYDVENMFGDRNFQQVLAKSSHGRRPITGMARQMTTNRMGTSKNSNRIEANLQTASRMRSSLISRGGETSNRPMTAIKAAGYTSMGRKNNFESVQNPFTKETIIEETLEDKCKKIERQVNQLLKESIMAYHNNNFKLSLEKAKEAGRKERAVVKLREQSSSSSSSSNYNNGNTNDPAVNVDLTFTVLFNLAEQYNANGMLNEALNTYLVIVKNNRVFTNAGKLKINIGNIYFRKKDYVKALKYYRMGLDQVNNLENSVKIKLLNNIGVSLIKLGKYYDALATFEYAVDEGGDYSTALNLILTAYCLDDADKMKESFQKLIDIPTMIDDEVTKNFETDVLAAQIINNDDLKQWERKRKQMAENTILTAAKIISPAIAATFTEGYAWCVEAIKQSVYAPLATELEMNKAVELLKRGEISAATDAFLVFNTKESKVASSAANNLAMLSLIKGSSTDIAEAETYADQSLSFDRYNSNAFVSRGNIYFAKNDYTNALQYYRESLNVEPSRVQALFNMGLVYQQTNDFQKALECYYKLNHMLANNVQVITQLAGIYEKIENNEQAIELYSQANSLAPTDPEILNKLGRLYDIEGDRSQAFQCFYDSFRLFPSNIKVIEWLGAYYIDAQFAEKAVSYFEKAAVIEPNNIKWQLMMASCERRSGNYQKALSLYKEIHKKFPENIECLKFLVRICSDLGMAEAKIYFEKLEKIEKIKLLREQRENISSQGKRILSSASSHDSSSTGTKKDGTLRVPSSRSQRQSSAKSLLENEEPYMASTKKLDELDFKYNDPIGPQASRPKTGHHIQQSMNEMFENDDIDDNLLPD